MNKKPISTIVEVLLGTKIPVTFHDKKASSMYLREVRDRNGNIIRLIPKKLVLSKSFDAHAIMCEYLPAQVVALFDQYHPMLFTVLHEVGHIKTAKGLNRKKMNIEYTNMNNCSNMRDCHIMYRQISAESRADKWAYAFALHHPNTCIHFSNLLRQAYGK